ncbi:MAG: DUF523 domain-containing protein [Candidatus Omnitrophota bacterium]
MNDPCHRKILVSACLAGEKCAYDGKSREDLTLKKLSGDSILECFCPELAGGLGCPREKYEILCGTGEDVLTGRAKVVSRSGKDETASFFLGATLALKKTAANNISIAVLKARSPSCGKYNIYSGHFDGVLRKGAGVTCALLQRNGIRVFSEEELNSSIFLSLLNSSPI